MEGGERKEEVALPPDYVSLAQLQERWLQKQEEIKLKQKREEEENRERAARAQNWRSRNHNQNQNQRGGAKIGGGFVRATGVIQESGKGKGKGKEIVRGGPGDGGENHNNIGKKGGGGRRKRNFKRAAAIEEKEKLGAEAEVLSCGGAVILSGEGGSGGGSNVVEGVGCMSAVEVLPRNGEIAHVNRTDLRGGFKKKGRGKGSLRVNELKQSEVAIDLENEDGGEKGDGSGKGSERGVDRVRWSEEEVERRRGRGSERGGDRVRGSEEEGERRRGSERGGKKGRGSERGGKKGRGGERWNERGGEEGNERGVDRGRGKEEEGERGGEGRRGDGRKNGGDSERKISVLKEYRPVVSVGNEVDLKLENKADQDEISEVCSGIAGLGVGDRNETRGRDNRVKKDRAEGESSNIDNVAVVIEKKVDHKVLSRKDENKGYGRRYIENGIWARENKAKEDGDEGGGSNGEKVAVEIEKKVDHKVLSRKGENKGYGRGYREHGFWRRENKAKEDGVEGGSSNGEKVAVDIEKKVDRKVLPNKGENGGLWSAYPANGYWRGRSYPRPNIYDDFSMKRRENDMVTRVWVKKEDKFDA